jgi:hypothetical protein
MIWLGETAIHRAKEFIAVNSHADIETLWSSLAGAIIMTWMFLSMIRYIVFDSSCAPWMRKGWGLRSLTDPLPWAFTRAYRRVVGAYPPKWVPWPLAVAVYVLMACALEVAADHLAGLAP